MSQNTIKRFDGIYRATITAVVRTWQSSPWRRPILILVILGTIFGSSAFFYGNPEPASALVQPAGRLFYGDTANLGVVKLRNNTFDYTFNTEINTSPTSSSSHIAYIVAKPAITRDEIIIGHLKVDGRLDIVRGTNGYDVNTDFTAAWNAVSNNAMTCTGTSPVDCTRTFDIAYERLSGRAMVVYAGDTSDGGTAPDTGKLYYCYWDGTNWGPVSNCAPTDGSNDITLGYSTARPIFVELKPRPGTDEIMMVTSLDHPTGPTHRAEAWLWSGSSWGNSVDLSSSNVLVNATLDKGNSVTVEWESSANVAVAVFGTDAAQEVRYKKWDGSWSSDTGGWDTSTNGADIIGINAETDGNSNRIGFGTNSSSNDFTIAMWKDNNSTEGFTTFLIDSTLENQTTGPPYTDVMWETTNSVLVGFAQNAGNTADPEYVLITCTTTCSSGGVDNTIPTSGPTDDGTFVRLHASPNSDDIMALYADIDGILTAQHWDGSAWEGTAVGALESNLSGPTAETTIFHNMSAAFAYVPYQSWQRNWRFFDDETVNDPSTGLNGAAENATPTGVDQEEFIRLRINVNNPQPQAQADARKKLQYTSGCNPNTSETACTWSDVGDTSETTAVWRYATSGETCANCSDNTTFATNRLTGSTQAGWYTSDKDAAGGTNMDHNASAIVELDFPLKAEDVATSTTYYFRMYDVDQDRPVRREQDNDGSNDCASATCTYPSLTTTAPTTTLSGGCFTDETEGTACTDDGSNQIKVAVNGTVDSGVDTVVDGSWSLNIATTLAANDILVVFIDGEATEAEEATTVVKYDGSGSITNVKLYQSQLVIGTDSGSTNTDQTITAADLNTGGNGYENSDDEDVLYDYTAGADITVDAEGNKSEQLYVINGDTYRPASGGGSDTTTYDLEIDTGATITADSNAFSVNSNWNNGGTFTAGTSTVTFTSTATGRTLAGTMTGDTGKFNNLIFNGVAGAWSFSAAVETGNDFQVSNGAVTASNNNLTVGRDFILDNTAGVTYTPGSSTINIIRHFTDSAGTRFAEDTSTVQMSGTGTITYGNGGDFHNLSVGYTSNTTTFSNNNWDLYGTLTFNGGTVAGGGSYVSLRRSSAGSSVTFASATTINGTQTLYHVAEGGSSYTYTITGGNYGSWSVVPHAAVNSVTYSLGGNLTSTGFVRLEANDAVTGSAFNTSGSNYSITASYLLVAPCAPTRTGSWAVDFNDSVIALSSTASSLYVGTNCGSHTLDLDTSDVTVNGSVSFVDGTGTIAITPGTSDFRFAPTASQTETYTPNGQSLWNMIINGANAAATVMPTAAVDVNNNFTITAGTYDTDNFGDFPLTIGGNYSNSGTFTARAATVTFDATDTGNTVQGTLSGSSAFYNLIFNGSGGEWTPNAAVAVTNDVTMTAGTLLGTQNITVNGNVAGTAGAFNLTGGTFEQRPNNTGKNFGTTSGTTSWTFNNLTFSDSCSGACTGGNITITTQTGGSGGITVSGILMVSKAGDQEGVDLNAGNRTWTLSGTGGDPFQVIASPAGDLVPSTSTFTYTGNNGAGDTTVQSETYNNLIINNGSETFNLEGATQAVDVTVTAGTLAIGANTLTATDDLIVDGTLSGTGSVNVTNDAIGTGTVNLTGGTFTVSASNGGNFGTTSGTNNWTFNNILFQENADIGGMTITTQTGGSGTITVSGTLVVGNVSDGTGTTLNAGNRTWNLTNPNHADPFQLAGTAPNLVPATSTFRYVGDNDAGSVTVQVETYCNLVVGNATAGETYILEGATSTTAGASCGDLTINATAIGSNTLDVVSGSNYALNIGGSYTNDGNFNSQNGTVTFTSTASGKTLNGQMTGTSDDFYNLVFDGVSGGWTFNAAVDVANDFTVTNGAVTANGNNLTVVRDFTLANTSGVSYVAGSTTVTVSRHYTDLGSKFSAGTSTLTMNGTGTLDHASSFAFYNLNLAYSSFTTTMGTSKTTRVSNDATLNGGTLTGNTSTLEFPSTATNTPLTFNAATTLNGSGFNIVGYGANTAGITTTVGAGNYGNWNIFLFASANNAIHNFGGNITTTAHTRLYAGGTVTGLVLNTQGHNFTSGSFRLGSGGATQTVSANFGASAVTLTDTNDTIDTETTGGSYNLDLGSSTIDTKGNILFAEGSGAITVTPGTSTLKWTHGSGTKTYAPNGQSLYNMEINTSGIGSTVVPTAAVDVNNNFTITTGTYDTVNLSNYPLTIGGNYSNSGTFTARNANVTFDATDTGNTLGGTMTGSSAFYTLTFNGSGGEWTPSAAVTITDNLILTNGSLLGTQDITVNKHVRGDNTGLINLTGGTFEQRVSADRDIGGSVAWTFNNLTFSNSSGTTPFTVSTYSGHANNMNVTGILRVGKSGDTQATTLAAGNRTWTLSGTGGDPFQILASPAGDLTPETSTFTYTGNNGSGDTIVQSETYNNLIINNGSETYNLEAATFGSDVTITAGTLALNGQTLNATNDLAVNGTLSGSTNVTVNGSVTGSGTINLSAGTFTQRITANANETFGSTSGTNNWTFNNLTFRNSDTNNHSITINPTGSGQIIVGATATFGSGTDTNTVTVDFDTNDRILDVNGSVDITTLGILEPSSSASFTVGDNWTNSGTFNHNNGTLTFDTTTTATFAGATTFYNFTSTTAAKTLEFTAAQTFTIDTGGLLTLTGAADPNEIQIKSTTPSGQWFINHQGTESVSYVQVVDSGCDVASTQISTSNSVDDGNNGSCWLFGSTFEQADYRFGEDPEDSSTGIDYSGPAENTAYTSPGTSDGFRLRMLIHVGGSNLAQNGETFKLQFGEKTAANCTTGVSWGDVSPSSGVIRYLDAAPADGDNISSVAGDPDHSGHTKQYQDFEEANNFTNSVSAINSGQDGVWAFSLINHSAVGGKRYCFKAVKSTGADLDSYSFYPEVIIDEELVFSLDATSKNFGVVQPGDNPTNQTSTVTVTANSATGYVVYAWSTQAMTKGAHTIPDWSGTNASPTSFPNGSFGFGYSTDDSTLTGGTADRFTNGGAKYAGFIHNGPGDPVADRTSGPVVNEQNTITYRLAGGVGQQAGTYTTVVVYVVATTF
jgi:hypothetical protein